MPDQYRERADKAQQLHTEQLVPATHIVRRTHERRLAQASALTTCVQRNRYEGPTASRFLLCSPARLRLQIVMTSISLMRSSWLGLWPGARQAWSQALRSWPADVRTFKPSYEEVSMRRCPEQALRLIRFCRSSTPRLRLEHGQAERAVPFESQRDCVSASPKSFANWRFPPSG